ncbi:hypothetical protein ACFFX1_08155 [Dactylosporangium sucinum]|nr:hypothetical protein [Dactylosporangium sucinum]
MTDKATTTPTGTVAAILTAGQTLTREQAEALTGKLKGVFTDATLDMIATAYVGKVWKPLDFPTWEAWCDAHLGVRLRLMKSQQDAVVKRLTEAGASSRALAAVLGISQSSASREQRKAKGETVTPNKPKGESSDSAKVEPTNAGSPGSGEPVKAEIVKPQAPGVLDMLAMLGTLDVANYPMPERHSDVEALRKSLDLVIGKLTVLRDRAEADAGSPLDAVVKALRPAVKATTRTRKAPAKAGRKVEVSAV